MENTSQMQEDDMAHDVDLYDDMKYDVVAYSMTWHDDIDAHDVVGAI